MKKVKMLLFGLVLISTITFVGCSKEGCTDPDSINYNADAKKDDGSCQYEGKEVFWYSQATSDALLADGATALTYYVDGQVVGSSAASVYWTGAPDCDQSGSISVKKSLGSDKTKTYTYSVKDQTGFEYWSGVTNYTANTCVATQLTW
jgi:hypothetical protein